MKKYQLKDICSKITDGSHNPPKGVSSSEYLMLSSKNIYNDLITFEEPRYLTKEEFEMENRRTDIRNGDVLLTIVGTIGRCAVYNKDENVVLQRSVAVLKPRKELIDSRFLMYKLINSANIFSAEAKGVAQKGIYLRQLANIEFNVPDLDIQKRVVEILDVAKRIMDKRKAQIEALDELVKSRFIEMFGKEKNRKKIGDLCTIKARIGWQGLTKKEYLEEGEYRLVTGVDFRDGKIDFDRCYYVSKERYEQDDNIKLKIGDVLVTKDGTIGKVAIVDKVDMPTTLNSGVFVVRDMSGELNNIFLVNALLSDEFKRFVDNIKVGATIAHLNQGTFIKYEVPIPPMEHQNQFAAFVNQVDKLKSTMEQSLKELENNFNSLMQRAFNGELFN